MVQKKNKCSGKAVTNQGQVLLIFKEVVEATAGKKQILFTCLGWKVVVSLMNILSRSKHDQNCWNTLL